MKNVSLSREWKLSCSEPTSYSSWFCWGDVTRSSIPRPCRSIRRTVRLTVAIRRFLMPRNRTRRRTFRSTLRAIPTSPSAKVSAHAPGTVDATGNVRWYAKIRAAPPAVAPNAALFRPLNRAHNSNVWRGQTARSNASVRAKCSARTRTPSVLPTVWAIRPASSGAEPSA